MQAGKVGNSLNYSYFSASTGLAKAALTAWYPTVRDAISMVAKNVITKIAMPMDVE